MLNEYGKFVRQLRIKNNENLLDMATKLEVSMAFLSKLESGKKTIPLGYGEKISTIYNLNEEESKALVDAINISNKKLTIDLDNMNSDRVDVSLTFARTINSASQKSLEELRKLLKEIESNEM